MVEVVAVDHLVISVSDFEKSKKFYAPLMEFLGFGVEGVTGAATRADLIGRVVEYLLR